MENQLLALVEHFGFFGFLFVICHIVSCLTQATFELGKTDNFPTNKTLVDAVKAVFTSWVSASRVKRVTAGWSLGCFFTMVALTPIGVYAALGFSLGLFLLAGVFTPWLLGTVKSFAQGRQLTISFKKVDKSGS